MRKLHNWFFPFLIFAVSIFVAFRNYVPGTWLLGWDSLLPELNFKLNIARSLSAVWQEYQGLGLLGGMAHAADLSRQLILWDFSLILPTSFLRYLWTFLMLCLGPLGVYFLTKKITTSRLGGFTASIFYLFNLATLQVFYTPFETFVSFYGFFPWLLYLALEYLKSGGRKRLLAYFILSVLATGAFYVQTLFIVYVVFLSVFAIETIVRSKKDGLLRSVRLALVTFFVNAFWLLPALYFGFTGAAIPVNSHINSIATPETQAMNQARAGFTNIATLKGYWFDYYDWGNTGTYDYLYKSWITYSSRPGVVGVSLALFVISVFGLTLSMLKKKTSYGFSFLILFGISYFMLNGGSISGIPFFSEIFRNAFTKWSNALALIYAVGLGLFVFVVSDFVKNKLRYFLGVILSLVIIAGSIYSLAPILKGNLIADSMRVSIPSYYLDTIDYFKSQDATKRIADFPVTDFWGWKFNDWGYRGSGFLWYGISQPILDRAFDVWSPHNEGFYTEISHAVEIGDTNELKYVLNKYQVSYILFDASIFEPGNRDGASILQKEKDLLESSGFISKVKEFGKVVIYQVNLENVNSNVSAPKNDFTSPFIVTSQSGATALASETFSDNQGYKDAKNCELKNLGGVVKKKLDGGNFYGAYNGGTACDYFYYPNLDYSQAYLMRIKGRNISGRSLKFYLYNIGKKNVDMQELLPVGGFDKTYTILPTDASASSGLGYTLNVETRSFGKVKSENLITAIKFYPVASRNIGGPAFAANNLSIQDVKKYGTWAYKIDVQGSGLIQLGQGYDNGWISMPNLKHVKVNSWANGFLVGDSQSKSESVGVSSNLTNGVADQFRPISTVYLLYWPQLLEWGGMVLGVATLVILIRLKLDRSRK